MDRPLGILSYLLLAVIILSLIDAGIGLFEPRNIIRVVSGGSAPISGELDSSPEDIRAIGRPGPDADLASYVTVTTRSPDLHLQLTRIRGRLWNGILSADSGAPAGVYRLSVFQRLAAPTDRNRPFEVRIFTDRAALSRDLPTVAERELGVKPYWLTLACLPAVLLLLFISYRRARQRDRLFQEKGFGVIHTLSRRNWGFEIAFGLGRRQGVSDGEPLLLLDAQGRALTEFVPLRVGEDISRARIKPSVPVTTDCLVVRRAPDNASGATAA